MPYLNYGTKSMAKRKGRTIWMTLQLQLTSLKQHYTLQWCTICSSFSPPMDYILNYQNPSSCNHKWISLVFGLTRTVLQSTLQNWQDSENIPKCYTPLNRPEDS